MRYSPLDGKQAFGHEVVDNSVRRLQLLTQAPVGPPRRLSESATANSQHLVRRLATDDRCRSDYIPSAASGQLERFVSEIEKIGLAHAKLTGAGRTFITVDRVLTGAGHGV